MNNKEQLKAFNDFINTIPTYTKTPLSWVFNPPSLKGLKPNYDYAVNFDAESVTLTIEIAYYLENNGYALQRISNITNDRWKNEIWIVEKDFAPNSDIYDLFDKHIEEFYNAPFDLTIDFYNNILVPNYNLSPAEETSILN